MENKPDILLIIYNATPHFTIPQYIVLTVAALLVWCISFVILCAIDSYIDKISEKADQDTNMFISLCKLILSMFIFVVDFIVFLVSTVTISYIFLIALSAVIQFIVLLFVGFISIIASIC